MLSVLWAAISSELVLMNAYCQVVLSGKKHVANNAPPPRIIAYPTDDSFRQPRFIGGNPKAILDVDRNATIVIHAESDDVAEGMRHQFVLALHKACKKVNPDGARAGQYSLGRGVWNQKTLVAKRGIEYTLQITVPASITDRRWADIDVDHPAQAPTPETYTGTQGDTYATQQPDTDIAVTVGVQHEPPADDENAVTIVVTKEEE
jgi:hypothetical protein